MSSENIDIISLKAFSHVFSEVVKGNQRFCFILGAGASKSAGIMTGREMTKLWISEIKDKYEADELSKLMKRFGVKSLEATSENYFSIYDLRFYPEYRQGQAFLEQEIEKGIPGLGHYVLAKILTDKRNNIALTTNFDSLIEDAIFQYTGEKAILIGHESLSQFVSINIQKPIIAKIHRGLYYNPLNRKEELNGLKPEWREILQQIFWVCTPIVIGYAGGDQSLMAFLKEDSLKLNGIYWCCRNENEISEEVRYLVHKKNGCFVLIDGFEEMMFVLAQKLGYDRLLKTEKSVLIREQYHNFYTNKSRDSRKIPDVVSIFDLYGISDAKQLQIMNRWKQNEAFRTLSIPIGQGAAGECIYFDIHEYAQGPNAIIASTAGYGKSEFIQSFILSIAINFHPNDVGFVLIDYKGGGLASKFDSLPHMLGTITNLDEESMRLITVLRNELQRRQRILSEYNVAHIDSYIKLYKQGNAKVPLPHLIIICDEIAEIRRNYPEYLQILTQICLAGRSLGVHLIFVTARPMGVIDDLIWSSCKSRICFKLAYEGDSQNMLKSPDAAYLTNVGRAYLQVGDFETYELFQAAWSGAPSQRGMGDKGREASGKTQCEDIVQHIIELCKSEKILSAGQLWLPLMSNQILSPYTQKKAIRNPEELSTTLGIGLVDDVETQTRREYILDFMRNGHILYMASEGYGKTTFLGNIILGLSIKNSVKNLEIYVLDMGSYGLEPYRKLNHVVDYFSYRDLDRLDKFYNLMMGIMIERKKLFDSDVLEDFLQYNQTHDPHLSAIVIAVDDYEHIDEFEKMSELIRKIAIEGRALGIYLAVTLTQTDAMKYSTMINFKERIAGFNYDKDEIDNLIGRSRVNLTEGRKGRALVDMDGIKLMQLYTPVSNKKNLQELIADINACD